MTHSFRNGEHASPLVIVQRPQPQQWQVLTYGHDSWGNISGWHVVRYREDNTIEVARVFPANVYISGSCALALGQALALARQLNEENSTVDPVAPST